MRAHCLLHAPFEELGGIAPWLAAAGYQITYSRMYESADLPACEAVDFLVAMGGPMSVNDERECPWLVPEKEFVRRCIAAGKPVLGVCLGAQLIASALGARVYRHSEKEIGWFPVRAVPVPGAGYFRFPTEQTVFHWHGETFDLPAGAVLLASSEACAHQAFQLGRNVLALQCHVEVTPELVEGFITHCGGELRAARYVQPAATIHAAAPETYRAVNLLLADVLAYLHGTGAK